MLSKFKLASSKLTKIATAKTKAKEVSKKTIGTKTKSKLDGKVIFRSCDRVTNKTNKKLERQIKADRISRLVKVFKDKEKTKS